MYFAKRPTVRVKQVGGDTLVLDDQAGEIHQLNQTASLVWQLCDGKTSKEIIVRRMAETFDVDPNDAERDVTAVIDRFYELRLLI
jgi:hypothetical protein